MPWRVPRRWWCGCDGSGVRRRRVRGRRGWRGGVGCGCTSSPTGRWRLRGRRGPSRGRRARTGPALVGLAQGLGGGVVVGGAHGSGRCDRCPRRRVVRCRRWTGTGCRGRCGGSGPRGRRRRGACAARSPAPGRRPRCRCPVRLLVAQPTIRRENRPRDEGGAAEPRPGRHVGEVDHPAPVWAGGGEVAAQQVVGDPVPLGGPGGAHRPARPGAGQTPAPACAAPAARAGHPGALPPGARQPPGLPGSQRRVERLGPQGEDPLVQGGVRDRPLGGRAGPGGVIGGRGDPAP